MPLPILAAVAARVGIGAAIRYIGRWGFTKAAAIGVKKLVRSTRRRKGETALEHVWRLDSSFNLLDRLKNEIESNLPSFHHGIVVMVAGGPRADIRRIWYLACAAAFGRYRNRALGHQSTSMECTWDITGKQVKVEIAYANTGGAILESSILNSGLTKVIQAGPSQLTIGDSWPSVFRSTSQNVGSIIGGVAPGLAALLGLPATPAGAMLAIPQVAAGSTPRPEFMILGNPAVIAPLLTLPEAINIYKDALYSSGFFGSTTILATVRAAITAAANTVPAYTVAVTNTATAPLLIDEGRVITTAEKLFPLVQNPKPPVDGHSRFCLLSMVTQAFQNPGFLITPPPAEVQPRGGSGVHAYQPGTNTGAQVLAGSVLVNPLPIQGSTYNTAAPPVPTFPGGPPTPGGEDGIGLPVNIPAVSATPGA